MSRPAATSRPRARRALTGVLSLLAAATGLAACGSSGAGAMLHTSAVFGDVHSLTSGASVQYEQIDVGSVTAIHLVHGNEALVTMAVRRSADVPANVTAKVEPSTILGQYVVDLVPGRPASGRLADHQRITRTVDVPGLQALVQSGTEVFGAISASQLSSLIANSAQAFGGQGPQLRSLLDGFGSVLHGYSTQTAQITQLVDRLDRFSAGLAPDAQANAQAVQNLAQASTVLADQSNRFITLLGALNALSTQTRSILDTGLPDIEQQVAALQAVAQQLGLSQKQLAELLQVVPPANANLAAAAYRNEVQVLSNIIVCGVPGLGEGNAATNTCNPGGGGS